MTHIPMKQTKLREPILYTALWVVSALIVLLVCIYDLYFHGVFELNYFLGNILFKLFIMSCFWSMIGFFISIKTWYDRHETRDMEKYILGKIKDIDDKIEELQEEKEELRKLIRQ